MSYLVLARKYRPQTFEQVVAQTHITRTLTNAISSGRVAHAILFSGPRGTGKTTVARVLAKAMNCKDGPTPVPCNDCRSCNEITAGKAVDVFEIDGASNNSVDQVRELRENIKYMPAHSPHKIYIIDEVHMLSTAAFNALLKTLEEPPSHVMFMFATTEPHKIPITILSRCQRHDFRRIDLNSISAHMASLCRQEGFEIAEESLGLIAREAGGSMRDGLSLLDQVMTCLQGPITHEQVLDILGIIDRKFIFDLSESILKADISTALDLLDDIYDRGHDMKKLYADLLEHFRNLLVAAMGKKVNKLIDLPAGEVDQLVAQAKTISTTELSQIFDLFFKAEASIRLSVQPKMALEMTLVRMLQSKPALPIDVLIDKLDMLREEMLGDGQPQEFSGIPPGSTRNAENLSSGSQGETSLDSPPIAARKSGIETEGAFGSNRPAEAWKQISKVISNKNPSLAVNLAKCKLKKIEDHQLEVEVPGNGITMKMIQREKNMAALRQVCADVLGSQKDIRLTPGTGPDESYQKKKSHDNELKKKALSHPLVADAVEIFDGKLVDVKII
ncbi:MAG: DNA polymerase III subunit gamma/tau [Desulfobacteraceae bacterium]|jgi:DNA polymerase-3 subunit gamma/tau|nr:DNA polymerase III subunit gamma/tau [Desulfobacteraceae bacterium]